MRKIVGRQVKIEIAVRSGTQETSEMYFIRAENEKMNREVLAVMTEQLKTLTAKAVSSSAV